MELTLTEPLEVWDGENDGVGITDGVCDIDLDWVSSTDLELDRVRVLVGGGVRVRLTLAESERLILAVRLALPLHELLDVRPTVDDFDSVPPERVFDGDCDSLRDAVRSFDFVRVGGGVTVRDEL